MSDFVFTWGSNEHGQCLASEAALISPQRGLAETLSPEAEVVSISCGSSHSLLLTDQGDVYSWGNNNMGQVGGVARNVDYPYKMDFLHRCDKFPTDSFSKIHIKKICAGGMFSIFLTQCGCIIKKGSILGDGNQVTDVPLQIPVGNITSVSCGVSHVVLLYSSGHVACFGRNMYGQIGIQRKDLDRNIETVSIPRIVSKGLVHRIMKIAAGSYHTLCCDEINQIFCWGYGIPCGVQKGHIMQPSILPGFNQPIKKIAAGASHSLFLTESQTLYAIGSNEFSQAIPNCNTSFINVVTKNSYWKEEICDIFCGENYSVVKTEDGNVSMWGKNSLIIDPTLPISHCFKTPKTVLSKDMLGSSNLVSLSCGSWHILCHISSRDMNFIPEFDDEKVNIIKPLLNLEEDYQNKYRHISHNLISHFNHPWNLEKIGQGRNITSIESPLHEDRKVTVNTCISTIKRERTHTTLRELYSKTPNSSMYSDDLEDDIEHSFFNINTKSHCSTMGGQQRKSKVLSSTQNQPKVPSVNSSLYSTPYNENVSIESNKDPQQALYSGIDLVTPLEEANTKMTYKIPKISIVNSPGNEYDCKPSLFPKILSKERFVQKVIEKTPYQKSKTEFFVPRKYCIFDKRSSEQFHKSLKFPHKIDIELKNDYVLSLQRSFLLNGTIKRSLRKSNLIQHRAV